MTYRFAKPQVLFEKLAEWSLYLLIFALPFSKSIVEITIVTALSSLIIKKLSAKERPFLKADIVDIPLYVFLFMSLASLANTSYMALSVRALFSKSLKFAVLFLIAREVIDTRRKLKDFATMALLSCIIIMIDGYTQYFVTHVDFLHNYGSFKFIDPSKMNLGAPTASFPYPNDFSAWILVFIFPIVLFAFWGPRALLNRVFYGAIFVSLLYLLILAKVRGAWASFLIAAGILSLLKMKRRVMALTMILLSVIIFMNKPFIQYVTSMSSASDRTEMWKNGWEIFKKHPIIGNGLNTFYVNYAKVRRDAYRDKKGSYAHNCYLQMAAEIGVIGLVSFLVFVTAILVKCFQSAKKIKEPFYHCMILGTGLGILAFLIHSFVDTNLYSLNLAALFWVAAGILMAAVRMAGSDI